MRIGARVSFDDIEQLESNFRAVDFPVELALPYRVPDFMAVRKRLPEVRGFIEQSGIRVLSIHATQGNLADEGYREWARPAMELADFFGATSVTFHPKVGRKDRVEKQEMFLANLKELQRGFQALAAVETFGGEDRILKPEEITDFGLPMVLDTAHLHEDARILRLVEGYHGGIAAVHLSARGLTEHHLPIDAFCFQVAGGLAEVGWDGSLVLEYLPWHHYRVRSDLDLLMRFLAGDKEIVPPPPDDRYRESKENWGFSESETSKTDLL